MYQKQFYVMMQITQLFLRYYEVVLRGHQVKLDEGLQESVVC